jgi:hypothetical protein
MVEHRSSSLRQDFRIFRDPGFLVALVLIGLLAAAGAGILIYANDMYGIPLSGYWK